MADDTPDQPAAEQRDAKPAPRRAPRKAAPKADSGKSTTKAEAAKPAPKRTRSSTPKKAPEKPSAEKAAPKPRASAAKRPAAKSTPSTATRSQMTIDKATETVGGKRNAAFLAGGLAVAGAAAAALLSLRSSSAKNKGVSPVTSGARAHQPDGEDSSASFEAGIADENTIPDTPQG